MHIELAAVGQYQVPAHMKPRALDAFATYRKRLSRLRLGRSAAQVQFAGIAGDQQIGNRSRQVFRTAGRAVAAGLPIRRMTKYICRLY